MPSINRVPHTATWDYITSRLPDRFIRSPKVVKEAIMTDINVLVQELWRTSSDGTIGPSSFAIRGPFEILQWYFDNIRVLFDFISVLAVICLENPKFFFAVIYQDNPKTFFFEAVLHPLSRVLVIFTFCISAKHVLALVTPFFTFQYL